MAPKVHSSFDVKNPYGETVAPTLGPGDPGFVTDGGLTASGGLGFGSGADVVASIGKKQRELAGGFTASRTDKYAGFDSEIGFNAAGRALEKDGGEFNTVGLQGAHDYSATEAGRFILEEKRKFEAAKAAMSETRVRDADGTIDRVDDSVAEALMPILFAIKERCRTEHINLESVFEEAGGTHFGTIKRQNFQSTLVSTFKRFLFEEETLIALVMAYGCGYQHPPNPALNIPPLYEMVGWKDFCEDVGKAYDTTEGIATEMAQVRTAWLTPTKLGMKSDLVEGWDPSSAQPNISLSDSPDAGQAIMTNVNPETILAGAGIGEKIGQANGRKHTAPNRRPNHPLLEPGKFAKVGKDLAGEMLMDACVKGDKTMVERLLGQNVDPNYQDDEESSVIMEACAAGQLDIVKMLVNNRASVGKVTKLHINWKDNDGNTALSEAKAMGHHAVVDYLVKTFPNAK